jgi:hypothetical protein
MESARYHRTQAELCLQMARHMSDPASANMLRANATRHFALATELENQGALARGRRWGNHRVAGPQLFSTGRPGDLELPAWRRDRPRPGSAACVSGKQLLLDERMQNRRSPRVPVPLVSPFSKV